MLNLKHTICPSCSTGCGITLISNNKELLGTYPYKRHEINEGKNCKNGRYCFTKYSFNKIDEPSIVNNGKLNESDFKSIIDTILVLGTIVVLYKNPKNSIYSLLIAIVLAFVFRMIL